MLSWRRRSRRLAFAEQAFGIKTAWEDRAMRYRETAEVRSREFAAHSDDEILGGDAPNG